MAARYADRIQAFYPTGPYRLLGWSFGGVVAHEIAIELRRRGCVVHHVVALDAAFRANRSIVRSRLLSERQILKILQTNRRDIRVQAGPIRVKAGPLDFRLDKELIHRGQEAEFDRPPKELLKFMAQRLNANQQHLWKHAPEVFDGDMVIFLAARSGGKNELSRLQSWRPYVAGDLTAHSVDCTHHEMLNPQSLSMYGEQLKHSLEP